MKNIKFTDLQQGRFPVIDVHTHFGFRIRGSKEDRDDYLKLMDRNNIAICVSLDAKLGTGVDDHLEFLQPHAARFAVFCHLDWQGQGQADDPKTWDCQRPEFARHVAEQLRVAKAKGVCGVKFFKQFGLGHKNPDGSLIKIDDSRWDPIWTACGQLGLPVIMHTGDPAAFFEPINKYNERYEELSRHPEWSFFGDQFPSRQELLEARNRVIAKHPRTMFIGAHLAGNPEDLQTVGKWLDRYPNLYIEPASRIAELGRQPYSAREFLIKHQDRILFGTDGPWPEQRVRYYWRFFETRDENFPYSEKQPPPQGMWNIYGLGLTDQVLRKLYFENACRMIPGIKAKYQAYLDR